MSEKTPLRLKIVLAVLGTVQTVLIAAAGMYLDYRTGVKDEQSKQLIAYQQAQLELVNQKLWERSVRNETDIKWLTRFVDAPIAADEERDFPDDDEEDLEEVVPFPPSKAKPRASRRVGKSKATLPKPAKDYVHEKRMEQRQLLK